MIWFVKRIIFPVSLVLPLLACNEAYFAEANSDSEKGSREQYSNSESGRRPTEGGEGVPGYLVDPNLVTATFDSAVESVQVQGQDGAVINVVDPKGGITGNPKVDLWAILQTDLAQVAKGMVTSVPGTLIESGAVGNDGAFSLDANVADISPDRFALVAAVRRDRSDEQLVFMKNGTANAAAVSAPIAAGEQSFTLLFPNATSIGSAAKETPEQPEDATGSGYLWVIAAGGASCAAACGTEANVHAVTRSEVGSGGSLTACRARVTSLGKPVLHATDLSVTPQLTGCVYQGMLQHVVWYGRSETSYSATPLEGFVNQRICACKS